MRRFLSSICLYGTFVLSAGTGTAFAQGSSSYITNSTNLLTGANFNIDGSGLIGGTFGIGTQTPMATLDIGLEGGNSSLHVAGQDAVGVGFPVWIETTTADLTWGTGTLGRMLRFSDDNQMGYYDQGIDQTGEYFIMNSSQAEYFVIAQNGNVGIGTTSPSALLSVGTGSALQVDASGDLSTSGNVAVSASSGDGLTFNTTSGNDITGTGGNWSIDNSGDISASGSVQFSGLGIAGRGRGGGFITIGAAGLLSARTIAGTLIENTIETQTNANFNIDGSGTIGTTLFATDIEDPTTTVSDITINTTSGNPTQIGNATGGTSITGTNWSISDSVGDFTTSGTVQFSGLTGSGTNFVTIDDSGYLGSTTLSGSFIENSNSQQTNANFNIDGNGTIGGTFLASGSAGVNPNIGTGASMIWIPSEAAFRAGYLDGDGTQWEDPNVGMGSIALGNDVIASGQNSTVIGSHSLAQGANSIVMGSNAVAYETGSFVYGDQSGYESVDYADNSFNVLATGGFEFYDDGSGSAALQLANGSFALNVPNGVTINNTLTLNGVSPGSPDGGLLALDGSGNVITASVAPVAGTGTQYYLPEWNNSGGTSLGNSPLVDDGSGNLTTSGNLTASGNATISGTVYANQIEDTPVGLDLNSLGSGPTTIGNGSGTTINSTLTLNGVSSGSPDGGFLALDGSGNVITASVAPVAGTGTQYYLPEWSGGTSLGNSPLVDDGSGNLSAAYNFTVSGLITPSVGDTAGVNGIEWPNNPGGGSGDRAWLNYYVETGEDTKLQIGIDDNDNDDLSFWQYGAERMDIFGGNVGIGLDPDNHPVAQFSVGTNSQFQVDGSGNVTTSGEVTATAFNDADSHIAIDGRFSPRSIAADTTMNISTTSGNLLLMPAGNVGIGTGGGYSTPPAALLSVGAGSALQVDGSGNLATSGTIASSTSVSPTHLVGDGAGSGSAPSNKYAEQYTVDANTTGYGTNSITISNTNIAGSASVVVASIVSNSTGGEKYISTVVPGTGSVTISGDGTDTFGIGDIVSYIIVNP